MTDNKFRAVLTLFASEKVLEMRFDGLNEDRTKISVIPNMDYRHKVNDKVFITAIVNLIDALNSYMERTIDRYVLGKMLGTI